MEFSSPFFLVGPSTLHTILHFWRVIGRSITTANSSPVPPPPPYIHTFTLPPPPTSAVAPLSAALSCYSLICAFFAAPNPDLNRRKSSQTI